jgi:hypothetical protein
MKESTRQKLNVVSTASRYFSGGVSVGACALAAWAVRSDLIADDFRLAFFLMFFCPAVVVIGLLPAGVLQIADGITKMKQNKE